MAGDLIPSLAKRLLVPALPRLREKTIIPLLWGLPDDIVHGKALQGQDDGRQAGSLDLGDRVIRHALLPELFVVEPVAFSG